MYQSIGRAHTRIYAKFQPSITLAPFSFKSSPTTNKENTKHAQFLSATAPNTHKNSLNRVKLSRIVWWVNYLFNIDSEYDDKIRNGLASLIFSPILPRKKNRANNVQNDRRPSNAVYEHTTKLCLWKQNKKTHRKLKVKATTTENSHSFSINWTKNEQSTMQFEWYEIKTKIWRTINAVDTIWSKRFQHIRHIIRNSWLFVFSIKSSCVCVCVWISLVIWRFLLVFYEI